MQQAATHRYRVIALVVRIGSTGSTGKSSTAGKRGRLCHAGLGLPLLLVRNFVLLAHSAAPNEAIEQKLPIATIVRAPELLARVTF
jgi:hypothetical protein